MCAQCNNKASFSRLDLSILLLTLNEEANIAPLVRKLKKVVSELGISFEVLVIDGASTDNTVKEAELEGARCIQQRRFGFGGALREGIASASGQYILTLDADWSHPPELIPNLWNERESADIIIASRYIQGGTSKASGIRMGLSIFLNLFFSKALSLPFSDVSSGFRLYRASILNPSEFKAENFDILEEVLVRAFCDGHRIREIPLNYQKREQGSSNASCLAFARSFIPTLFRMWVLRNSIVSADYDHRAFYSILPPQRYWQRRRYNIIREYTPDDAFILDVGCGSSKIIQSFGDRAIALDVLLPKLRFLRTTNKHRVQASAFYLPFGSKVFSCMIHSEVLEHIECNEAIFQEMNRVLTLGATLVIGTPDYGRLQWRIIEWLYKHILPNAYGDEHITQYTRHMLIEHLAKHGFRIVDYKYICGGELIIKAQKVAEINQTQLNSER